MQEYMREKRWEARSQAETTLFEQEPQLHACKLREVEVRRRNTRQRKKDDPKLSRMSSSMNQPMPAPKKTVIVRLKQDSFSSSETRPQEPTKDDIPNTAIYHSSSEGQLKARPSVLKRGFFLDAGSFARLADIAPETSRTHDFPSLASAHQPRSLPVSLTSSHLDDRLSKYSPPVTHLSAARTDPFDVLPMQLSTKDHELFDFYATVMPTYTHGFEGRYSRTHRWYRDVLIPEAMKGAVTFQNTVLQHAAVIQASVMGLHEKELACYHKSKAAKMLEQHCRKFPKEASDEIISATVSAAGLADLDPCVKRKRLAWHFWATAMHQIQRIGGTVALEQKSSLCKLINWYDYVLSGYDGRGSSFYFTPESTVPLPEKRDEEVYGRQELVQQCEEFLVFLGCVDQLTSVVASQSENVVARQYQPLRYSIFAHSRPLYHLLGNESKWQGMSADPLRGQICRLASLITINVAMWEHRFDSQRSEAFLEELTENIKYEQVDKNRCTEILLQILLYSSDSPASRHTERPWLVGRLLKVAKRLSRSSWEWVNGFLWSCLALSDHGRGQLGHWEKRLRKEILEAPLYKHSLSMLDE